MTNVFTVKVVQGKQSLIDDSTDAGLVRCLLVDINTIGKLTAFEKRIDHTELFCVVIVVGLNKICGERRINATQHVIFSLNKVLEAWHQVDLFEDKAHLIVIQLGNDSHLPKVSFPDLLSK